MAVHLEGTQTTELFLAAARNAPRIADAFRTGGGASRGEHDLQMSEGSERFFRPCYEQHLARSWIPALDGVEAKLWAGAHVADVGCGRGASTIVMARAYPSSLFVGFDTHAPSIERARRAAGQAGVGEQTRFEAASALDYPVPFEGYDLIAFFDCLRDLADPAAAVRRAHNALAPNGTVLVVEPIAGGGLGLGAPVPESRLRELFVADGFAGFRRVAETPFNRVFEARC